MALICSDGLKECSGCMDCLRQALHCTACGRKLNDGEKYLLYSGAVICCRCLDVPDAGAECALCGEEAYGEAIAVRDAVLCRRCAERNIHIS